MEEQTEKIKGKGEILNEKLSRISFTLTSRDVKALENVAQILVKSTEERKLDVKDPVRYPTKTFRLICRKSPCGNGTATFDRWEMRIKKRYNFNLSI